MNLETVVLTQHDRNICCDRGTAYIFDIDMPCAPGRMVSVERSVGQNRTQTDIKSEGNAKYVYLFFTFSTTICSALISRTDRGRTAARIVLSHDFSLVSPRHKTTFDVDARSSSWKAPASITAGGRAHLMAATQSSGIRSSAVRITWAPLPRRRTAAFPVLHRWQVADTRRCVPLPRHHIHLCLHASGIHTQTTFIRVYAALAVLRKTRTGGDTPHPLHRRRARARTHLSKHP